MMAIGQVRWIFIHTAAYSGECDAAEIDAWHRARGWSAIGYHYVVRRSGHVEPGRDLIYAGAHVEGCNSRSLGICCEGHGDYEPHTGPQRAALLELCRTLMERYDLTADSVLGHREVNGLIDAGLVGDHYRTSKTCPGRRVDMDEIRAALQLMPEPGAPHPLPDLPEVAVEMVDSMSRLRRLVGRITPAGWL
jgi:N-acetylmuramoyl-L-alanine amidase